MIVLCLLFTAAYAQNLIQVNTTEGVVQGSRALDGNHFTFYDIPYAGPTSGENRFKAPTPAPLRTGVFDAINRNIVCAQPTTRGLIGTENCLTLSIFTKNLETPKPVFVWVDAEEYTTTTTATLSYSKIVEQEIVFVKLNFRVSIFGFLCLGVPDAPGNAGLKDILHGLHWVRENIANFGGDPSNVVLIGHGSGAALVDMLTLSPRSNNLIHKAIVLSGSALAPWAVAYDPIGYANLLGASLNYTMKSPEQLAALLKTTDINLMASALSNFKFTNNTPLFAPCLENLKLNPNETVLFDAPINILRSGNFSHIPYIAGYTSKEGTLRASEAVNDQWLSRMQANFTNFLPVDVNITGNATLSQNIRTFYFSGKTIDMSTINEYLDYQGDTLILTSIIRTVRERSRTSTDSVRLLEFAYIGTKNSDWPYTQILLTGARHGAFVNFLFNYDLEPKIDDSAMEALVKRLTTFAHNGTETSTNKTVMWPPVKPRVINYLYFAGEHQGEGLAVFAESSRSNPYTANIHFWENIYSKYYVAPKSLTSSANSAAVAVFLILLSQIYLRFI